MSRNNHICPCCNEEMEKRGFDNDWMVFECSACSVKVEKPFEASVSDSEGYTMENLVNASKSADRI